MDGVFLIKIALVPLLLWIVTAVSRRYGRFVGAILSGLPLVSGPVSFFIAWEQGAVFGAQAAVNVLPGICACVTFGVCYVWVCRHAHWSVACIAASVSYFAFSYLTLVVPRDVWLWSAFAFLSPVLGLWLLPRAQRKGGPGRASRPGIPWLQMGLGVAVMLAETGAAAWLGPRWSGLVVFFPVLSGVVGLFAHIESGPDGAREAYRGSFSGQFGAIVFAVTVAFMLGSFPIWATYACATLATLAYGVALSLFLVRKER